MKQNPYKSHVNTLARAAGAAVCARRPHAKEAPGLLAATLSALLMLASARAAGPVNPKVTYGNASFQKVGNNWVITTSGKAIIRYSSFDIAWGQWVRFIQPGADSRVLNRIDGSAPTRIEGTIMANGQVYFVNPAGVIFGNGAVINCGSFAAAAGQLSDQDFLAGKDHFTNLSGNVVNNGRIEVPEGGAVKLIGQHVANYGTIVAPQGTVVLAAGNDVLVGENGGRIYARISGDGVSRAEGVRNDGAIEAAKGRVMMAAGDIYGMAVINTGRVVARNIKIDGGKHGEVRVAGTLDASGKDLGEKGGRVEITGEKIALTGADIDVSGDSGGGVALIGGGREGKGLANAADALYVDSDSKVNADAIRTGNGGSIVLYSHNSTRSGGKLTARGGTQSGNGGYIETSGGWLSLSGAPDTSARALLGKGGEWLIDPLNLDIVAGPSSGVSGPPVFTPTSATGTLSVADLLLALGSNSVVTLKTTGTVGAGTGLIRFQTMLDLGSMAGAHTLNVLSAGGIEINAAIHASSTGDALNLNLSAVGNVTIASGVEVLLNSGTFTSSGVDFNGGKLISAGAGGVWLNHTGAVTLGSVTTQAAAPGTTTLWVRGSSFDSTGSLKTQGGKIDIQSSTGNVNIGGGPGVVVDAGGGDIAIRAKGVLTSAAPLNGNNISLFSGGDMSISGNAIASSALDMRAGQDGFGTLDFTGAGPTLTLQGATINLLAGNTAVPGSFVKFSRSVNLTSLLGSTSISAGAGTIQVLGGTTLTQTLAGTVTMTADEVDFSGSVNSAAGGRLRFATGSSGRNISIGSATAGTLNLSAAELLNIGAGYTTLDFIKTGQSGNVSIDGAVTMARAMNILLGSGAFKLNADLILTNAGNSFSNNGRTLVGPGSITLQASSAFFGGLVDASGAGANFHVKSAGQINFVNSIGSGTALASLTVDGGGVTRIRNLVRAGTATFSNPTEILSNTTFNSGPVTFAGSLDSGVGGPFSATFLGGTVSFLGGVGQTQALSSLLTVGDAIVAGNVRTIGSQTYGGTMTVNALSNFLAGGSWSVLGSTNLAQSATVNASTVFFAGAIDSTTGRDLTVTSPGTITFASDIGLTGALRNLTVNGGGLTRITGTLRLTGAGQGQFFNATELLSDVLLTGGSFTFVDTLDSGAAGPFSLVATGPGTMSFAKNVGAGNALRSIDTSGAFMTQVGGNVFTTLNQTYSQLRLTGTAGNRLFNSTTGDIFYNGAVGALTSDIGMVINTPGLVTFNSTAGSGVPGAGILASISRTGGGQTTLRGNTSTVGIQSFDGNVLFDNPLTVNAGGALTVLGTSTLNGNVNLLATSVDLRGAVESQGGPRDLHVTSAGLIKFGSTIGAVNSLGNLLVDGGGETRVTTLVRAVDAKFMNAVNLTGNTVFSGGDVLFASTLDSLTAGAFGAEFSGLGGAGTLTTQGPVGGTRALNYLISHVNAKIGGNVSTLNQQQYDKLLEVTGPATFTAGGAFGVDGRTTLAGITNVNAASVLFGDFVDSAPGIPNGQLFVQSAGPITFTKSIGSINQLVKLDVSGGGVTTINDTLNVQTADFRNSTLLGSNVHLQNGQYAFHQKLDSGAGGPFSLDTTAVSVLSLLGVVGGDSRLLSIDGLGAAQTVLGANVTAQDFIRFGATRLDGNSTVKSFAGPIDFGVITSPTGRALGVDTPGVATFNGTIGTLLNPLASVTRTGSGLTILKGDTFTSGVQTFAGDVRFDNALDVHSGGLFNVGGDTTLAGNVHITSLGANFAGAVESQGGPRDLHVTSASLVNFGSTIGAVNSLGSLLVDGGGETRVTTVVRAVDAKFLNAVNLTGNTVFSGGDVLFASSLDSLTAGAFGAEFSGLGGAGTLTTQGPVGGTRALNYLISHVNANIGGNVSTSNQQQYDKLLNVTGPATFTAGGAFGVDGATTLAGLTTVNAASVFFGDFVDSAPGVPNGQLFVQSAGPITFTKSIGSINQLVKLDVSGGGLTTINDTLNVQTADFRNNTLLGSNVHLQNGQYAFHQKLDSGAGGPFSLDTTGVSVLSLLGVVGGDSRLQSIDGLGAAQTVLGANVTAQDFIRFGATRLDTNSTVKSFAGPIDFGVITSPTVRALGVDTPGIATFNGTIGTLLNPLASITRTGSGLTILKGDTFTSGVQTFAGDVRFDNALDVHSGGLFNIGGDTTLAGNVHVASLGANFAGTVESQGGPRDLHVTSAGLIKFGSTIGAVNSLGNLLVDGGGETRVTTLVRAVDAKFMNAVNLTGNTVFSGGDVLFASTLDSLAAGAFGAEFSGLGGAGSLTTQGAVGGTRALNYLISHVNANIGGNVSTSNQQQYDKLLEVTGPATFTAGGAFGVDGATTLAGLTTVNAASVLFGDFVDSAPGIPNGQLFVQSAGPITFTKSIGSINQLVKLDVSGGGVTTINDTLNVQTADFHNNTLLGSNVHLQNGQYAFHQKLDSGAGGPFSLDTTGVSVLSLLGVVGGDSRLLSIDGLGAAQTVLGANVTAQDFIRFGATRLDANSTVKSFAGPIDFGVITSPTGRALGVDTPGIATFNGTIGTLLNPLASIIRTGSGLTILKGDTFTSGVQTFAGDVRFDNALNVRSGGLFTIAGDTTLAGDVNINTLGANFVGTVDSAAGPAHSLHVTSSSPVIFGDAIGSILALQNVTVDGGGVTILNTLVHVLGAADFENAVRLGSDLNLQGGTFLFGDTVDSGIGGPFALNSIGSGTVEFVGDVGGLSLIKSIDTSLAADARLHGDLNARDSIRLSQLRLLGANTKTVSSETGTIDFLGAVASNAASSLQVVTPNTVEFHSTVGSGIGGLGALGSIVRTGAGLTTLDGNTLTTGGQSFAGDLDLNGALTLTSGGIFTVGGGTRMFGNTVLNTDGYNFGGSVDSSGGVRSLIVNNSGTGFFANGLGGGGALSALTINGAGVSQFAGNVRLVPGGVMTLNQAAEIRGASDFRAGTINFNSTLNASIGAIAPSLLLIADAVNFNANVGSTRALASLNASGVTLSRVTGNVTTTGAQIYSGLMLAGAPGIRSFTAGNASFATIDAAATDIGMNVAAPGAMFFGGPVGFGGLGGGALASLTTGAGPTTLAGNTRTIGATTFGGALITTGVRTVNASALTVLGTTTIGNNFTFNGVNARFAGAVNSAVNNLGSMLINATNEARFENGVGQSRAIASFRSNASSTLLRGSMRTSNAGQTWFSGLLRVDSAPTGLTTIDTGNIFVGRDIYTDAAAAGPANLSLIARAAPTIEVAPVRIGGNIGLSSAAPNASQRIGTLTLGTGGPTPQTATIIMARTFDALGRIVAAGISSSDSYTIAADSFSMAAGQKLTVLGTLNLTVAGNATIADMTTLGDMNVNAGSITIVSRAAYSVLDNHGNPIADIGTDLVAGGAVNFNRAPVLAPGAGKFSYSAIAGPDPVLSAFSFRQYPTAITLANFVDDRLGSPLGSNFVLSLDFASQGPTTSNVADTKVVQPPHLGEVEQVPQSVTVDPADQELLRQLGLSVQGASMQEIVSSFVGYSYYQNVPKKARPSVENRDYVVTADRLWMKAVVDLAKSYKATMQRTVVDESGHASVQPRDAELRQMFADSWDRFTAGEKARSSAEELAGYQAFLLANADEKATREEMAGLSNVISKLQALGLTKLEAGIPEEKLLEMVRPPALSTDDMRQIIKAVVASGVTAPAIEAPVEGNPQPTRPQESSPVAEKSREMLKVSKR